MTPLLLLGALASAHPTSPTSVPILTLAHPAPRAIRVRRSPR
ncbi:hypothetical protein ACWD25_19075 [Streptomyces sp. NPDC002920]